MSYLLKGLVKRSTDSGFLALLADDLAGEMRVKCRAPACKAQTHVNMLLKGLKVNQHLKASFTSLWDGKHGVRGRFVNLLTASKMRCFKVRF